ncbi:MAG: hypothetical protein ACRCWI_08350 [Brevinema sp.]
MSILGVLLLISILCVFSIMLLADQIAQWVNRQTPNPSYQKIQEICQFLQLPETKKNGSYIALLFGIWNLFGPNFGSLYGGPTIIGALIPSLMLCINAFILNPELLHWVPNVSFKEKLDTFLQKITPTAGWITVVVMILHSILYREPFF